MSGSEILKPGENIRPIINEEEAKLLIEKLYGLRCLSIKRLNGYDDRNYKVSVIDSDKNNFDAEKVNHNGYVLKIMNALDSKKLLFVEAQNAMMLYLCENGLTCPKPIKNKSGEYYSLESLASGKHVVRLLEFLPGDILHQAVSTPNLLYQIGQFVATLDTLLKNFHHKAYDTHQSLWMLDSVPLLKQFLFAITDLHKRKLIGEIVTEFQDRVLAKKNLLEIGIIHGDFNEQNIVVELNDGDWKLKGILDFGDSQKSCFVFELAITITYMIIFAKNIDAGGYVLAGYSTVRMPTKEELSVLKVCVAARLSQSLVLGAYTSLQDPGNDYILTTAAAGWDLLTNLWSKSDKCVLDKWNSVAENYRNFIDNKIS